MKTSYQGRAFLAREEGCVLSAYKDSVGVRTIGIGHTTAAGPPVVTSNLHLTLAECFALFEKDLAKYEARVNRAITVRVPQHVYDAAVSFDYNSGAILKASWVDSLNRDDMADAAKRFMLYNKPPEIIGRRSRELHLLQTGDYGNIATIPVWERQGGKVKAMPLPQAAANVPQPHPAPLPPIPPAIAKPPVEPPQPLPEPVSGPPATSKKGATIGVAIVGGTAILAATWGHIQAWVGHLFGQ